VKHKQLSICKEAWLAGNEFITGSEINNIM